MSVNKSILVISGSPRPKGNTYKIASVFEQEVQKHGDFKFEYLFLKKMNLEYCRGCLQCMKKGEEHCPCKDDSLQILEKLNQADGLLLIGPVYVHSVSALMKNFFDRFAFLCHQPRFHDRFAGLIVTTELSGAREALDYMSFPLFTWGYRVVTRLGVVYDSFAREGRYRELSMQRIARSARLFAHSVQEGERAPALKEMVYFNLMKSKVSLHREMLPRDFQFWEERGWNRKAFFNGTRIPGIKRRLAETIARKKVHSLTGELGLDIPRTG